jgi:hypothetical protein
MGIISWVAHPAPIGFIFFSADKGTKHVGTQRMFSIKPTFSPSSRLSPM